MDKYQVLIVEDDKDTANFFDLVFNLLGFRCLKVHSAESALSALENLLPDMILLDLHLDHPYSGEQILLKVRSDRRFDATRVVVITAYPVMARAVTDLADLVLIKPVDVEQLKLLTGRLLGMEIRPRQYFFRDPTTDLFNQEFFHTRLEHAFERSKRREDFHYGVVALAIHVETETAKTIPSPVLKQIYRWVAERLKGSFRPTDTLAHFEGNQFASLHEELKRPEDIEVIVQRMREALSQPCIVADQEYAVYPCIGAATNSASDQSAQDILLAAQQASKAASQLDTQSSNID